MAWNFSHFGAALITAFALNLPTTAQAAAPAPTLLQWDFSPGFINLIQKKNIVINLPPGLWTSAIEPATLARTSTSNGDLVSGSLRAPVSASASSGNELQNVESAGGIMFEVAYDEFNNWPDALILSNLSVDLVQSKVYADFHGVANTEHSGAPNIIRDLGRVVLWDIGQVTTSGQGNDWTAQLSGLTLNAALAPVISEVLQLNPTGNQALANVGSYGTITLSAVPEPSTYALAGIGLMGIFALRRRQTA